MFLIFPLARMAYLQYCSMAIFAIKNRNTKHKAISMERGVAGCRVMSACKEVKEVPVLEYKCTRVLENSSISIGAYIHVVSSAQHILVPPLSWRSVLVLVKNKLDAKSSLACGIAICILQTSTRLLHSCPLVTEKTQQQFLSR